MLFVKTASAVLPAEIPWEFLVAFYVPSIAVFFLGMLLARYFFHWKTEELGIAGITSCYGTLALLGLPIILSSFNREFLIPTLILIASQSMVLFAITIFWLEKGYGNNVDRHFLKIFVNKIGMIPIVLS